MGICGLLQALKPMIRREHISSFRGKTIGVDTYCWLHKAVYSCSMELCQGMETDKYITYCFHLLDLLLQNGVQPFLVFDGSYLPAKAGKEAERKQRREENLSNAKKCLAQGDVLKARTYFSKAVEVTPFMAHRLVRAVAREPRYGGGRVRWCVAPYEADAQLGHLARAGVVDAVLTEDSDIMLFGTTTVLFKLDRGSGAADVLRTAELRGRPVAPGLDLTDFSEDDFLLMCIVAGCDYLPSVKTVGVKKAYNFVRRHRDPERLARAMRFELGLAVPGDYAEGLRRAALAFRHQTVFRWRRANEEEGEKGSNATDADADGDGGTAPVPLVGPLTPFSDRAELKEGDADYVGPSLDDALARRIAACEVDPITREPFPPPPPPGAAGGSRPTGGRKAAAAPTTAAAGPPCLGGGPGQSNTLLAYFGKAPSAVPGGGGGGGGSAAARGEKDAAAVLPATQDERTMEDDAPRGLSRNEESKKAPASVQKTQQKDLLNIATTISSCNDDRASFQEFLFRPVHYHDQRLLTPASKKIDGAMATKSDPDVSPDDDSFYSSSYDEKCYSSSFDSQGEIKAAGKSIIMSVDGNMSFEACTASSEEVLQSLASRQASRTCSPEGSRHFPAGEMVEGGGGGGGASLLLRRRRRPKRRPPSSGLPPVQRGLPPRGGGGGGSGAAAAAAAAAWGEGEERGPSPPRAAPAPFAGYGRPRSPPPPAGTTTAPRGSSAPSSPWARPQGGGGGGGGGRSGASGNAAGGGGGGGGPGQQGGGTPLPRRRTLGPRPVGPGQLLKPGGGGGRGRAVGGLGRGGCAPLTKRARRGGVLAPAPTTKNGGGGASLMARYGFQGSSSSGSAIHTGAAAAAAARPATGRGFVGVGGSAAAAGGAAAAVRCSASGLALGEGTENVDPKNASFLADRCSWGNNPGGRLLRETTTKEKSKLEGVEVQSDDYYHNKKKEGNNKHGCCVLGASNDGFAASSFFNKFAYCPPNTATIIPPTIL